MAESTPNSDSASQSPLPSGASGDSDFEAALRSLARAPHIDASVAADLAAHAGELSGAGLLRAVEGAQDEATPRLGSVLDERYRVVSVLGRGGMGVVFGAENLRTGKPVALKWMSFSRAEPGRRAALLARFEREARAVAKVRHPNVVDVYDVGYWQGKPFLVMERLVGESLRARIARGALSWNEARPLLLGVLRGVAAVHQAGVVHRDLKPDNIFLCSGEAGVVPKVLDFGVAAMREADDGSDTLTRTGAMLGTPSYMALEQLTGGEVDKRADIYALGVVLFELLTQRLPFAARSAADLAVLQATGQPTRPSQLVPTLRGELEHMILRALASDPARRFASADEWALAVEQLGKRPSKYWRALWLAPVVVAVAAWGLHSREGTPTVAAPQVLPTAPLRAVTSTLPNTLSSTPPALDLDIDAGAAPSAALDLVSPSAPQPARRSRSAPRASGPAAPRAPENLTPALPTSQGAPSPLTGIRVDDF